MTTSTSRLLSRGLAIVMAICLTLLSAAPALADKNVGRPFATILAYTNEVIARGKVPYSRAMKYRAGDLMKGNDVAYIQYRLIALGFQCGNDMLHGIDDHYDPIDGVYGTYTRDAIIQFQKQLGLTADGICGKATYKALLKDNFYKPAKPTDMMYLFFAERYLRGCKLLKYVPGNLMKNLDVMSAQMLLRYRGCYDGAFDGIYGKETFDAVVKFQRTWTDKPDGMVGAHTFSKLAYRVPEFG